MKTSQKQTILLTGATGYVGGRLLTKFDRNKYNIRCMARTPSNLKDKLLPCDEVFSGNVIDKESIRRAMTGVDIAYYLVHSMEEGGVGFEELDRIGATNFMEISNEMGIKKIVYLGGLGTKQPKLSTHLRSRHEVGEILRTGTAQVIELQASIIIGSGSISFEMVRALVERLPIMITPKWVSTRSQPIAVEDILHYLEKSADLDLGEDSIFQVGGSEVVSYGQLMNEYAMQRNLRRIMIKVPLLTPRLSSLWLGLITPVYARIGRKLIDSLRNENIVEKEIDSDLFDIKPMSVSEAIRRAIICEDLEFAQTNWSDSISSSGIKTSEKKKIPGNRIVYVKTRWVDASTKNTFAPIKKIGGSNGWYYANFLWSVRGVLDLLIGGVGIRRGRQNPNDFSVGDAVDWFRVEKYEKNNMVRFRVEMKVPGRAWLEFRVEPEKGGSRIHQIVEFDPWGLLGLFYWYILLIPHNFIFNGMLDSIAEIAETMSQKRE
jgi:uncharacterized protein YbjT (DUF2867 family)